MEGINLEENGIKKCLNGREEIGIKKFFVGSEGEGRRNEVRDVQGFILQFQTHNS